MAGKDKILRYMRAYVGGYDLSGDARTFSSLDFSMGEIEMMGWSDTMRYYLADGMGVVGMRGFQAFVNDAAGHAFPVMKDAPNNLDVVIAFGGGAAPALGDPAYLVAGLQPGGNVQLDGSRPVIQGDFIPGQGSYAAGMMSPLGRLVYPKTQISATTDGTYIDDGAQTTEGAFAVLHVLEASSDTWTIKLQDSADHSSWADLITFTSDGQTVTSESGVVTGTVDQYLRAQFTATAGSLTGTFLMAVSRGHTINEAV